MNAGGVAAAATPSIDSPFSSPSRLLSSLLAVAPRLQRPCSSSNCCCQRHAQQRALCAMQAARSSSSSRQQQQQLLGTSSMPLHHQRHRSSALQPAAATRHAAAAHHRAAVTGIMAQQPYSSGISQLLLQQQQQHHSHHHHHQQQQQQQRRRRRLVITASGPAGGVGGHGGGGRGEPVDSWQKRLLLGVALAYIGLVVLLPFINVFLQAFAKGAGPFLAAVQEHDFLHATKLTLLLAAVAVPLNTLFGTVAAILITRNEFPGKVLLLSLLDLPFSISPVVTGLMLMLLYGRAGWFAQALADNGWSIVFAFPGMALATMFVTLPFIVRELIPTLEQMDLAQEEAAQTLGANPLQVFWHVTLPNIRWGLMYGVILTNARAMGEFGAVSVISGNIIGRTQTLTLFVESAYKEYNSEAAFAAAVLLSVLALGTLWVKDKVEQAAAAEAAK